VQGVRWLDDIPVVEPWQSRAWQSRGQGRGSGRKYGVSVKKWDTTETDRNSKKNKKGHVVSGINI
jgi:hypothetical protein